MAAPAFASVGSSDYVGSGENTFNPSYPSTVNADDIFLLACFDGNNGEITTPAGWTKIQELSPEGGKGKGALFWKRAVGTETGTIAVVRDSTDFDIWGGFIARYTGCITSGNPYDTVQNWRTDADGDYFSTEIITTGVDRLVVCVALEDDDREHDGLAVFTQDFTETSGVGSDTSISFESQSVATAQTVSAQTGKIAGGFNDEAQVSFTIDLKPPDAGGRRRIVGVM